MNGKDKQDLQLVLQRLDHQDADRKAQGERLGLALNEVKKTVGDNHEAVQVSIHTLKVSLFDPHEGLWAETKKNSGFRRAAVRFIWIIVPLSIIAAGGTVMTFFNIVKAYTGSGP